MRQYFETLRPRVRKLISVLRIIVAVLGSNDFKTVVQNIKTLIQNIKQMKGD